jgi:hypothetical protein
MPLKTILLQSLYERIFDSGDKEGNFGEDVEGDHSQESKGDEDPIGLLPFLPVPCS